MLTYQLCWLWQRADSLLKKWSYWPKPCVEFPCLFNFFNTTCQFQKTFKENTCLFKKKKNTKPQVSGVKLWHEAFPSVNLSSSNRSIAIINKAPATGVQISILQFNRSHLPWLAPFVNHVNSRELLHNSDLDGNGAWESYIWLLWKTIPTVLICT